MGLTESNFLLFAAKNYDMKRATSYEEFQNDLKRIQYLKRLFKRYQDTDELKVRLILNHLTVFYNCFGKAATPILFMKLKEYHTYLKPFVVFLNFMPEKIFINGKEIFSSDISLDENIVKELRKI